MNFSACFSYKVSGDSKRRFSFLLSNENVLLNKVTINLNLMTLVPDLEMENNPELLELPLSVVCFSHNLRL
jgi:hypothetical protein